MDILISLLIGLLLGGLLGFLFTSILITEKLAERENEYGENETDIHYIQRRGNDEETTKR